ncbi:MAG: permease [Anaerolineales bacterium]|nr:permease [Anaerolineales bacterium]
MLSRSSDVDFLGPILQSGIASLVSYLAAHVLLCLVPAFFVAGALSALVPQASVVRFLGPGASKWVAYPAAAGAGSLLAVCSCTVQPLFAGIYKQGAGLGPAMTFMFFAPAANILALSYTGVALGGEFAFARLVLSLVFGVGIGMIMAVLFYRDDLERTTQTATFQDSGGMSRLTIVFLLALVALLIGGTLKLTPLTTQLWSTDFAWSWAPQAQATLDRWLPVDELRGDEGLSLQGAVLIGLLVLIGMASMQGLGKVDEGFNRLTWTSLGLIALTLVFAAVGIRTTTEGLHLALTARSVAVAVLTTALVPLARRFDAWDVQQWLWETWRFVKQIFPLLVAGVFIVGMIRVFIQPAWVQAVAGQNTLLGNMAGVVFGVFMYFPTLVEVPVAKMLLSLGMHPGPLLAYIMADPELSLQSMLITASIIGRRKTATYVALVAVFATAAGLAYGAWTDGRSVWEVALSVAALGLILMASLRTLNRRRLQEPVGMT